MSGNKKPGDWDCPACDHLNFSRRDSCQRCGEQRPPDREFGGGYGRMSYGGGGGAGGGYGGGGSYGGRFGGGSGGGGGGGGGGGFEDVRPGDWYCPECNAHNFASRTGCFKCGCFKDEPPLDGRSGGGRYDSRRYESPYNAAPPAGSRSGWKSGDWICSRPGCQEHNFASRLECFRCSAPREAGM